MTDSENPYRRFNNLTVKDVEGLIEEWFNENEDDWDSNRPSSWEEVKHELYDWAEVPGLGRLRMVEEYGGEGQGEDYWVVIEVEGKDTHLSRFFRKNGWYASFSGGELDGDLFEVQKVQRLVTLFEEVK